MPGGASSEERGALPLSDGAAFAGVKPDGRPRPRAKPTAAARPDFAYSHRVDSGLPPLHATRKHDFCESAAFVANLTVGSAQKSATFEAHLQALPRRAYPSRVLGGYSRRAALGGVRTAISALRHRTARRATGQRTHRRAQANQPRRITAHALRRTSGRSRGERRCSWPRASSTWQPRAPARGSARAYAQVRHRHRKVPFMRLRH
jgi:hypothetical protein